MQRPYISMDRLAFMYEAVGFWRELLIFPLHLPSIGSNWFIRRGSVIDISDLQFSAGDCGMEGFLVFGEIL
ncbi:hypothetical protein L1987_47091 [Smallanthus sonchifolius]|uniref:Uncharacterized protein n=1 Tax=Smallanthus sonchifolius TaxID=185202 RepID=A0ACB9G1L1_9ASTR|nr:hypothetical protein L1987_47091 [Smallanthus sonchifolius]